MPSLVDRLCEFCMDCEPDRVCPTFCNHAERFMELVSQLQPIKARQGQMALLKDVEADFAPIQTHRAVRPNILFRYDMELENGCQLSFQSSEVLGAEEFFLGSPMEVHLTVAGVDAWPKPIKEKPNE